MRSVESSSAQSLRLSPVSPAPRSRSSAKIAGSAGPAVFGRRRFKSGPAAYQASGWGQMNGEPRAQAGDKIGKRRLWMAQERAERGGGGEGELSRPAPFALFQVRPIVMDLGPRVSELFKSNCERGPNSTDIVSRWRRTRRRRERREREKEEGGVFEAKGMHGKTSQSIRCESSSAKMPRPTPQKKRESERRKGKGQNEMRGRKNEGEIVGKMLLSEKITASV